MLFINNHQMAEAASDVTAEPTEAEKFAKRYPSLAKLMEHLRTSYNVGIGKQADSEQKQLTD
jgi:putative IMPACT (imprinted ancient) family translation regulator